MARRVLIVAALLASLVAVLLPGAASASAYPATWPFGGLDTATLDTYAHRLYVTGWDYDPANRSAVISAEIYVDGRHVGNGATGKPSPAADRVYHLKGNHGFVFSMPWTAAAPHWVNLASTGVSRTAPLISMTRRAVAVYRPSPGDRIVAIAKQYVGRVPYIDGGASPRGFDCSGYTQYSYAAAHVAALPRTADEQRHARGMRIIPASAARPGDLVFYLSGSYVYHVAIYAGGGMQYAAATPQDGIRYQHVWSSDVLYGTDWH